jgi:DNA-binding NarL/FixJ family response regulator
MRVAVADDDLVYRAGLVDLLDAAGIDVTFQASNGRELLDYLTTELLDVVILDIRMNNRADDGLITANLITERHPAVGILILSTYNNYEFARRFFANGAAGRGYLLKERLNDVEDLQHALNLICRDKTYSDTPVLDTLHRHEPSVPDQLTARELNVLRLLAIGRSNAAIGRQLRMTSDVVESCVRRIYDKLDIPRTPDDSPRVHAAGRWLREARNVTEPN